jgi:hypothetical protein
LAHLSDRQDFAVHPPPAESLGLAEVISQSPARFLEHALLFAEGEAHQIGRRALAENAEMG